MGDVTDLDFKKEIDAYAEREHVASTVSSQLSGRNIEWSIFSETMTDGMSLGQEPTFQQQLMDFIMRNGC